MNDHTPDYHIGLNAHLLSDQAGYRRAGIHSYIAHTLEALPAADPTLRYTVFVGAGSPPEHPAFQVRRAALPTASPPLRILWEQIAQPWQTRGLDLLHGMAFATPVICPVPTVVTVYDLSFIFHPERLSASRRAYLSTFTGRSVQHARRVIAISASTARDITRVFGVPEDRIDIARPGVGPEFKPLDSDAVEAFRARMDLPPHFILHVGTLEPRKNLPVLLEAYARLPESLRAEVPLVLVGGKGWGLDELWGTVLRLGVDRNIRLEGYAPDEDLPLWYNAATLLVYPSVYEGWGMPVVEALACGTPALVSDISSLPEAAGDAGLRLNPHSVEAWAAGLEQALTDEAWRTEAIQRGLAHAATLRWEHTAAVHAACYRRALES
ncbi:MAG: glycosyltransferase family 1 protein [Anaerolineae bacterium]